MAETKDVVDRADQLMRRRRTFIAVRPEPEPEIPLPPENNSTASFEDEDIPTLTEEVIVEALPPEPVLDVAACEPFDESRMLLLAADMSQSISEQITRDLPELLDRVLLDAGESLRAGVSAMVEAALQNFMDQRKQPQLPPDGECGESVVTS